tara:strand:- start:28 stop:1080 length:1053 start_codon:yes stop_codon:yes gene_type:complete
MAYTTIDDPSAHFQVNAYSGASNPQTITNGGNSDLQPDLMWNKRRDSAASHYLLDSTRGVNSTLFSDTTAAQDTATGYFASFNSDGFTTGSDSALAYSGRTYVAWQWAANGGTTASNTNGTITSTVQANTDAGFSIISYTGNGSDGATIGHGLNQTPQVFFPKCLSTSTNWEMYYFPTGGTRQYGYLNLKNAFATWPHNAPSSTIISLSGSGDSNGNGRTNIGYAFHSVQGYSKIGTYKGTGNADGPFIYTGFKPAWVMIKNTTASFGSDNSWIIQDSARNPTNKVDNFSYANTNRAEGDADFVDMDFLSNGFKLYANEYANNYSGDTMFYMAFAESPFVSSEGIPTTAR